MKQWKKTDIIYFIIFLKLVKLVQKIIEDGATKLDMSFKNYS